MRFDFLDLSSHDFKGAPLGGGELPMNAASPRVDGGAFRRAMRELAAGVSIVASGAGAARVGCTVTSLTSFSLAPPTLLVCIARGSSTLARIRDDGAFAVSLLAARHAALADRFAGREGANGARRFDGAEWLTLSTGAPMLADALAAFDCRVEETIERHTHAIVLGAVVGVRHGHEAPALAHWRSGYETLK